MKRVDYAEIVHRCFRCGYCKFPSDYSELNCPSYARYRFETYFSGGRMWLIRGWLRGDIDWSEHFGEIMYSCTTCRNCVERCVFKFSDEIVDIFISVRSDMVENGLVPKKVAEFFNNIAKFGNPWGVRGKLELREYASGYLLHAGCVARFDDRAKKALSALAEVLEAAEVEYGILSDEICEGNEVLIMGEFGLFEDMARKNISRFEELGVRRVLTPDPHAYNAFANYYPQFGAKIEVLHHTQLLAKLISEGKLRPDKLDVKVTYHDPCFLGRWNEIYEEPRNVISKVATLVEMRRSRKDSFCCGGGSGNFYTDYLSGENSPARIRVREAAEVAEILVTACPVCLIMLENAAKDEGLSIRVLDVAELLLDAL